MPCGYPAPQMLQNTDLCAGGTIEHAMATGFIAANVWGASVPGDGGEPGIGRDIIRDIWRSS
jgi:hypothetical protein